MYRVPRHKIRPEAKRRARPALRAVPTVPKWLRWAYQPVRARPRSIDQLHDLERDYANGARTIASETLKILFLINGGAVVVIMGLIGSLVRGSRPVEVRDAATAVILFGIAVILLGIAAVCGWTSQRASADMYRTLRIFDREGGWGALSDFMGIAMAGFVILSLVASAMGMRTSMDAIVAISFALEGTMSDGGQTGATAE